MTVLVTGAGGFVGKHLTAELDLRGIAFRVLHSGALRAPAGFGDALRGVESVVHLAALAHERAALAEREGDYALLREVNALAGARLAEDAARAGARRFVFVSTIGVHGEQSHERAFDEASPLKPVSLYARSKLEAEQLLAQVGSRSALAITVLRPTLVYGPRNPGNFLKLLRWVDRGWPLPFASIRNRRSLTHVGNLVSAIVALLARAPISATFVVSDAEPFSTPQLMAELARGLERPARLFPFPPALLGLAARALGRGAEARRLIGSLEVDASAIRRVLEWQPPVVGALGLRDTARWYRAQYPQSR